jgi:Fe-S oxidoreductase
MPKAQTAGWCCGAGTTLTFTKPDEPGLSAFEHDVEVADREKRQAEH